MFPAASDGKMRRQTPGRRVDHDAAQCQIADRDIGIRAEILAIDEQRRLIGRHGRTD